MNNQSKPECNVTPIQIAYIVYRYLCDNNFTQTSTTFQNEASSFLSKLPINKVPQNLKSLGFMLNEYTCLKEQKVMMDQERVRTQMLLRAIANAANTYNAGSRSIPIGNLVTVDQERALMEQERIRIQVLLQAMENGAGAYLASRNLLLSNFPMPNAKSAVVPQAKIGIKTTPGIPTTTTMQNTSNILSVPQSVNTNVENGNSSTPVMSVSDRKRKDTVAVDGPSMAKKPCGRSSNGKLSVQGQSTLPQSNSTVNNQILSQASSATQSSAGNCVSSGSQLRASTVAKCLFNQPPVSIPANSTKRVMVSPAKQMVYIESSHCIPPGKTDADKSSKRDHVRSGLDFNASNMPESLDKSLPNEISTSVEDEDDVLSLIDFTNFNFDDPDFPHDAVDFLCNLESSDSSSEKKESSDSEDDALGSSHECKGNQMTSELPSTMAEALSERDLNIQGPGCLAAKESVTNGIKNLSPEKNRKRRFDQEK